MGSLYHSWSVDASKRPLLKVCMTLKKCSPFASFTTRRSLLTHWIEMIQYPIGRTYFKLGREEDTTRSGTKNTTPNDHMYRVSKLIITPMNQQDHYHGIVPLKRQGLPNLDRLGLISLSQQYCYLALGNMNVENGVSISKREKCTRSR